jgi:hypothetical protein
MLWENVGVAPPYRDNTIAFRITHEGSGEISVFPTETSIQGWLPGETEVVESLTMPESLNPGQYKLEIGIVDGSIGAPSVRLAIEGRAEDGWYPLSQFEVVKP